MNLNRFFLLFFSLALFSLEILSTDASRFQVREQIKRNLEYISPAEELDHLYALPVLCIGTGRNEKALMFHPQRTIVLEHDITIDIKKSIGPDFVCDAWEPWIIKDSLLSNSFGFIFFAHAGIMRSGENPELLKFVFYLYKYFLTSGGVLIFNSEVFQDSDGLNKCLKLKGDGNNEKWKKNLVSALCEAGFTSVHSFEKKENENEKHVSLLIIAQ